MEMKKNPKFDLDKRRSLFLNLGLVISLSLTISAFEWKSVYDGPRVNLAVVEDVMELTQVPLTSQPPPPPPPKPVPVVVVESKEEVEEEILEIDTEFQEEESIVDIVIPDDLPEEIVEEPFTIVEDMPSPVGGMEALFKFIGKNMKYPRMARSQGIEGRVFVQFIVDKQGSLTDLRVVKGIGSGCDEEALRVMRMSPKWNPGKQRGKPVPVRMILPIYFRLN